MFSFLFAASRPAEAAGMFALSGLVFLAFTVGYRTRLFHALSLACVVSLHSRAIFLENGGDVVLNLLCAWTLFLPMGARFSVDALRKSFAAKREKTIDDLNDRGALPAPATRPVASLAVLAIIVELSLIYYLNALHKTGWTWRQGMAVHYAFYQERMVTWLGHLVRPYLIPELTRRMTYTTWNIELLSAPLILNPFFKVSPPSAAACLSPRSCGFLSCVGGPTPSGAPSRPTRIASLCRSGSDAAEIRKETPAVRPLLGAGSGEASPRCGRSRLSFSPSPS